MNNSVVVENQKLPLEATTISPQARALRRIRDYQQISLYKDVNPLDWEDWHWQLKHRVCSKDELQQIIKLTPEEEEGVKKASGKLSLAITPYWAALIDPEDPNCPLRRQAVPVASESIVGSFVSTTSFPSCLKKLINKLTCADFPEPSNPSTTINFPG